MTHPLAALIAGVKVKPLVWRDDFADHLFGWYEAIDCGDCIVLTQSAVTVGSFPTLEAAKAAAQADYEARIMAAMEAAPHVNETPKSEHDAGNVLTALPADVAGVVEEAGKIADRIESHMGKANIADVLRDCRQAADTIRALIALATAQAAQIAGLQRTYEELYADALADAKSDAQDFDSDLWIEVRKYLTELRLDWRDYGEDGISAEQVIEYIRECVNEETRRAEAAEAEAHACGAERERWKERAEAAEAERDRQYDENVHRIAEQAKAEGERDALRAKVAELEARVAEVTSDRAYIIGANAGWEAAVEQGEATPAAAAMLARADAAETEAATLRAENERLRGALQWCSGSDDFQDGGKAREGWLKLCAPLLHGEGKA